MSGGTIKSGNLQVGQDGTASNNFTWYQPAVADGTVRLGVGVAGATTKDMVTVSGTNITLGGNLVQAATAAPAFSAYMSANQTVSTGVYTKLQCNTEQFDTNSNYDTTNYRFTPTVAGYYQVNVIVCGPGVASGLLAPAIYKNGSYYWNLVSLANTAAGIQISSPFLIYLNGSTDYIEFYVYQNTGSSQTIYGNTGNTVFQAFLARSA